MYLRSIDGTCPVCSCQVMEDGTWAGSHCKGNGEGGMAGPGDPRKGCQSVSSVAQSCATLCDPMNRSTPGLPVHHQLPEFTQTHVHRVGDAIQPSHPLSSPCPPAPNPSQHQGLREQEFLTAWRGVWAPG